MLNPDGVANGYTRLDSNGLNLNAHYKKANQKTPSIFSLKKLIKFLKKKKALHTYIDLHSHLTKRGIFFFGNPINSKTYIKSMSLPYLFFKGQKGITMKSSSKYFL